MQNGGYKYNMFAFIILFKLALCTNQQCNILTTVMMHYFQGHWDHLIIFFSR